MQGVCRDAVSGGVQNRAEETGEFYHTGAGGVLMKKALPIGVENFEDIIETG